MGGGADFLMAAAGNSERGGGAAGLTRRCFGTIVYARRLNLCMAMETEEIGEAGSGVTTKRA